MYLLFGIHHLFGNQRVKLKSEIIKKNLFYRSSISNIFVLLSPLIVIFIPIFPLIVIKIMYLSMQRFLYLFLTISLFNHLRKKLNTHLSFEYAEFWG